MQKEYIIRFLIVILCVIGIILDIKNRGSIFRWKRVNKNIKNKRVNRNTKNIIKDKEFGEIEYYSDSSYFESTIDIEILGKTIKTKLLIGRTDDEMEVSASQREVYNIFYKNKKKIEDEILQKILSYYNDIERFSYGPDDEEENKLWWPEIKSKKDLVNHLELDSILIPATFLLDENRIIYLLFNRDWGGEDDEDNGVAVKIVNEHVIDVGYKDIAYMNN